MRLGLAIISLLAFWSPIFSTAGSPWPTITTAYSKQKTAIEPRDLGKLQDWTSIPDREFNGGFTPDHFYFKVHVQNGNGRFQGFLEIPFKRLLYVDLISPTPTGFDILRSGAGIPTAERPVPTAMTAFPLDIGANESREFYLHIRSNTAVKVQLRIKTTQQYHSDYSAEMLYGGLYCGLLVLMVLYSFMLYWAFREKVYLAYVMTNLGAIVYYLSFDGILSEYIFPEHPMTAHALLSVAGYIYSGSYLLFIGAFTLMRLRNRVLHRVYVGYGIFLIAVGLSGHAFVGSGLMNKLIVALSMSVIPLGFAGMFFSAIARRADFRWFQLGNIMLLVFASLFLLFLTGIVPENVFTRNALRIGTLIELLFFSLALAVRIRTIDAERKHAEVRAEARTQFAANFSHEIRTPLTAVVGVADLLAETELAPQQKKFVQTLQAATSVLHALANDVLAFAKLDNDKIRTEEIPFFPAEILEKTLAIHRFKATDKHIQLTGKWAVSPNLQLLGDPLRIGQILNNLLSNAIKFTPEGGTINLEASVVAVANRQMLECRVVDSGIGIAPEKLAVLFSAYTQAELNTERLYGGTGLGLHISHKLAKLMNGNLEALSNPGKGSQFKLTLYHDLAATSAETTVVDYGRLIRQLNTPLKILHIDDQPDIRMLFQFYFANTPHQIDSAETAEEGLELFKMHQHDFVFTDKHMPGIGGLRGIEEIQRFAADQQLKVHIILCSGSLTPGEVPPAGVKVLMKPIRTRDVYATMVEMGNLDG